MAGGERRRNLSQLRSSFPTIARLMLLPIGGALLFLAYLFVRPLVPSIPAEAPRPARRVKAAVLPQPPSPQQQAPEPKHVADIVLILDDVGFDHQQLGAAMTIDRHINFSVLPNAPHGVEFANELHASGFEVLCHLPMEPEGFPEVSPGSGAVLTSMSDAEIARATTSNVSSIPYARGVNNHMGSRATADRRVMRSVLSSLPHGMYFIDSRTSGASVGATLARQMNVPTAARNVFLDDIQTAAAIRRQLAELRRTAAERGVAIGIGHMYPVTIRTLAAEVPQMRSAGFRFIHASEAVR